MADINLVDPQTSKGPEITVKGQTVPGGDFGAEIHGTLYATVRAVHFEKSDGVDVNDTVLELTSLVIQDT